MSVTRVQYLKFELPKHETRFLFARQSGRLVILVDVVPPKEVVRGLFVVRRERTEFDLGLRVRGTPSGALGCGVRGPP